MIWIVSSMLISIVQDCSNLQTSYISEGCCTGPSEQILDTPFVKLVVSGGTAATAGPIRIQITDTHPFQQVYWEAEAGLFDEARMTEMQQQMQTIASNIVNTLNTLMPSDTMWLTYSLSTLLFTQSHQTVTLGSRFIKWEGF